MTDNKTMDFCGELCEFADDIIRRKNAQILELQGNLKFVRGTVERLLELSDEQKAKIEQLKEAYSVYEETTGLKQVRTEAIKEFAERIHSEIKEARNSNFNAISERVKKHNMDRYEDTFCFYCDGKIHALDGIWYFIDNLVKEMTEETP